jgi:hypothetical protein
MWKARRPGKWLVHCHIPHHTTNNNAETHGGGGLTMIITLRVSQASNGIELLEPHRPLR